MSEINLETHKTCTGSHGCGKTLLRSAFTNDKSKKDGKRNRCKSCQRAYNSANPAARLAADKKYRVQPHVRYAKYKASALSRGFKWRLTRDQFMRFWNKACNHCGVAISTIGLDRVDSNKPYQVTNIEPCCSACNRQKSDWTTEDWYAHMDKIATHRLAVTKKPKVIS